MSGRAADQLTHHQAIYLARRAYTREGEKAGGQAASPAAL